MTCASVSLMHPSAVQTTVSCVISSKAKHPENSLRIASCALAVLLTNCLPDFTAFARHDPSGAAGTFAVVGCSAPGAGVATVWDDCGCCALVLRLSSCTASTARASHSARNSLNRLLI